MHNLNFNISYFYFIVKHSHCNLAMIDFIIMINLFNYYFIMVIMVIIAIIKAKHFTFLMIIDIIVNNIIINSFKDIINIIIDFDNLGFILLFDYHSNNHLMVLLNFLNIGFRN